VPVRVPVPVQEPVPVREPVRVRVPVLRPEPELHRPVPAGWLRPELPVLLR
jgi:hypothetical protein